MATCPSCGGSNVSFRRESVGEVRGRGASQVIHRTVGICKDCGYTFEKSSDEIAIKKPRKTWLWVLGWIFIFPVPLTVLMLRKKDMNSILRAAIIVIGWVIYLGMGYSGRTVETSSYSPRPASRTPIDVDYQVEPNYNNLNNFVSFKITTNMPETTLILVTVMDEARQIKGQNKVSVPASGVVTTDEFTNGGEGFKGRYVVELSTSLPDLQPEQARQKIGNKGQNLTGPYVVTSDYGSKMTRASFYFEF